MDEEKNVSKTECRVTVQRLLTCTVVLIAVQFLCQFIVVEDINLMGDLSDVTITDVLLHIVKQSGMGLAAVVCSVILCRGYWDAMGRDIERKQLGDSIYPSLMVAQGTYFTFLGISIILFSFNQNNTGAFISGLKLAFATSIVGVIYSIAAKIRLKLAVEEYMDIESGDDIDYYDEAKFYQLLQQIAHGVDAQSKCIDNSMKNFTKNVEKMLLDVAKKQNDNTRKLFDSLMKQNSQINTELTSYINKQFDEINFATNAMNEAIKDVAAASEHVSEQMSIAKNELCAMNSVFTEMNGHVQVFKESMGEGIESLSSGVAGLVSNIKQLDVSSVADNINSAFAPIIQQGENYSEFMATNMENLDKLSNEFMHQVTQFQQSISAIAIGQNDCYSKIQETMDKGVEFIDAFPKVLSVQVQIMNKAFGALSNNITAVSDDIEKNNANMQNAVGQYYDNMKEYAKQVTDMAADMHKVIVNTKLQLDEHNAAIKGFLNFVHGTENAILMRNIANDELVHALNGMVEYHRDIAVVSDAYREAIKYDIRSMNEQINEIVNAIKVLMKNVPAWDVQPAVEPYRIVLEKEPIAVGEILSGEGASSDTATGVDEAIAQEPVGEGAMSDGEEASEYDDSEIWM